MRPLTDGQYRLLCLPDGVMVPEHLVDEVDQLIDDGLLTEGGPLGESGGDELWGLDLNRERVRVAVNIHRAMMARESQ